MDQKTARNARFEIDAVTIKKCMTEYHHLINGQVDLYILTQQSMGGNYYGKSGHLSIFISLKHLMVLLRCNFVRASFAHLIKYTDSM